jgi:flagellar protein FlgJ
VTYTPKIRAAVVAAAIVGANVAAMVIGVPAAPAAAATTATARTGGGPLNVRTGPGTSYAAAGSVANGARLAVVCQVAGQMIRGTVRQTAAWDRLSNGRYVSDAYVAWSPSRPALATCGAVGATVRTGGDPLNLRANASTWHGPVGTVPNGARITVACQLAGQTITGTVRRSSLWNRLSNGRYLSDAYVAWSGARPALPWCQFRYAAPGRGDFISSVAGYARQNRKTYGVPASVTIAQAIHESGWGRSGLSSQGSALFGIKCFGIPGPIAAGCRTYATTECADDKCFATTATFRVYRNTAASINDHGRFLTVNPRYSNAFRYSNNPDQFAREIHKAGYATGPGYANAIIALMRSYNLYKYDR